MAQQDKGRTRDIDIIVGGYQDKLVINVRISKTKPRMRYLINVKEPHFLCF